MTMLTHVAPPVITKRHGARIGLEIYRMGGRNPTGVHRYALSLAAALAVVAADDDRVEVWTAREKDGDRCAHGIDVSAWLAPRRPLHLAWAAVQRPLADRFTGELSLLHQLTNVVPVPTRQPLVVTVHDVMAFQHPEWYERAPRWAFRRALRYAADEAARIVVPSERVRLDVEELLGVERARIRVIPEGVGAPFTQSVPTSTVVAAAAAQGVVPDRYFVTVGEISPRKNLPTLFRALAALRGRRDVLPLLVVGADGMDAARIRALAADVGVADLVRFTGRVSDTTLAALVRGARALLHPSSYEGFGLTPLEAMASGTAVVASNAGALPEVVGDAGVLVDPADPAAWAAAMARGVCDLDWVAHSVAVGKARAARFTWTEAAEKTWAVYEEVLAR